MKEIKEILKSTRGVSATKIQGRNFYLSKIVVDGEVKTLGYYKTIKEAGMAYDLYVVKNNLKRKTNYLRKKETINTFA